MTSKPDLRSRLMNAAIASIPLAAMPFLLAGGCQPETSLRNTIPEVRQTVSETMGCEDGQCDETLATCLAGGDCRPICRAVASTKLGCGGRGSLDSCRLRTAKDGSQELLIEVTGACPAGRRPQGLVSPDKHHACSGVGAWLANQAYLEAASVPAFRSLAAELALHGAPEELVDAALTAAEDEVQHAELMTALARSFGTEPQTPNLDSHPLRSLHELALDNEIEGCVRETVGAALCWRQSMTASDPQIRETMARIAEEETGHAELSQKISEWARSRLATHEIHQLDNARQEAIREVLSDFNLFESHETARVCGLPMGADARLLVAESLSA